MSVCSLLFELPCSFSVFGVMDKVCWRHNSLLLFFFLSRAPDGRCCFYDVPFIFWKCDVWSSWRTWHSNGVGLVSSSLWWVLQWQVDNYEICCWYCPFCIFFLFWLFWTEVYVYSCSALLYFSFFFNSVYWNFCIRCSCAEQIKETGKMCTLVGLDLFSFFNFFFLNFCNTPWFGFVKMWT